LKSVHFFLSKVIYIFSESFINYISIELYLIKQNILSIN